MESWQYETADVRQQQHELYRRQGQCEWQPVEYSSNVSLPVGALADRMVAKPRACALESSFRFLQIQHLVTKILSFVLSEQWPHILASTLDHAQCLELMHWAWFHNSSIEKNKYYVFIVTLLQKFLHFAYKPKPLLMLTDHFCIYFFRCRAEPDRSFFLVERN